MQFSGKLDIKIISGDLTEFTSERKYQNLNTFVTLFIDNNNIGETDTEYGTDVPTWNHVFSTQLASMNELRIEIYSERVDKQPKKLAWCVSDLAHIRARGQDRLPIRFHQEMAPMGKVTGEVTFYPKKNKIKRGEAVREKKRLHRGHRYEPNYFPQLTKCAFCGEILWGVLQAQGLKCQNCSRAVHRRCYDKDLSECIKGANVENSKENLCINISHR